MYSTPVFTYVPRQVVVFLTGNSERRFMPQYAKSLTLNKGVDNRIQFQFLNQEQRPVDITGKDITCRILDASGEKILLSKTLNLVLPLTGIATLEINAPDIENIAPQKAFYSLEIPEGEFDFPVFVDQNAGARGIINIVDSVLPSFVPSQVVSIPQSQEFPNVAQQLNSSGDIEYTYFSSVIDTQNNPVLTIQVELENYNGDVIVQGSTQPDSSFYTIIDNSYQSVTDTFGYTVQGFHPFVRVKFVSDNGEVKEILAR